MRARPRLLGYFAQLTIIVSVATVPGLLLPAPAASQTPNKPQVSCIRAINKAASKVAKTAQKQYAACIKDAGNDLPLPGGSVDACVDDVGTKLGKSLEKTLTQDAKSCAGAPPFGYAGALTANSVIVEQEKAFIRDLFGTNLSGSILSASSDADGARCQAAVAKRYGKFAGEILRTFISCKSDGLKGGLFSSAGDLQGCFQAVDSDAKGRIKKAFDKLVLDFIKRCSELPDPLAPFAGECSSAPDLLTCVSQRVHCRTCLQLNGVDNLAEDCERRDNGAFDGSCVDPLANECAGENGGNNCHADAACTDVAEGWTCSCNPGYLGDGVVCVDADECAGEGSGNNCDVNAACTNTVGSFTCECNVGYGGDGTVCVNFDECAGEGGGNDCDPDATCTDTPGGYFCECDPGYLGTGVTCTDADECAGEGDGNNCDPNAACSNIPGSFTCACLAGFVGDGVTCADLDECAGEGSGNNCSPIATCTNTPGSFTCSCPTGYSGDGVFCVDDDECAGEGGGNNCDPLATCANTPGSFTCTCPGGYSGDGTTCTDDDECAGEGGGNNCDPVAVCTNTPGSFSCACPSGYNGDGLTCTDIDECNEGTDNCDANAACANTPGSFTCTCDSGYEGSGVTCTDIDECALGTDTCDPVANCTNFAGGFNCACPAGFAGDGFTCIDFNECVGENGGNNCNVNATCTNIPGSFSCSCDTGWLGNGVSCSDANECLGEGPGDNCDANATCANTIGSFTCTCNAGYGGDGVTCTDLNECIGENGGDNCHANATCINEPGTFSCQCNAGFSGDGVTCVDVNECSLGTDNCDVNATCTNTVGSFTCSCNSGYGGDGVTCTDLNECFGQGGGNNCSVNATCLNTPGSFDCECDDGYFGNPFGGTCDLITVQLTSPTHGVFTQAGSIGVTGTVTTDNVGDASLTINGSPVSIAGNGSFSTSISLSSPIIFNEVRAEVTQVSSGATTRDRRVVIVGPSNVVTGELPQSVAMRLNDTGFDALEPILTSLVDFDVATLLPVGTTVIEDVCVQDSFLGCIAKIDRARVTQSSLGSFGLDIDSMTNFVAGDVQLSNLFVDLRVDLTISGIGSTCDSFSVSSSTTNIFGDYGLEPGVPNTSIDVNQLGNVNVVFGGFSDSVNCGGIGFLSFLINLVKGDVQSLMKSNLESFLNDPDGGGPQDAVIAQAIEDALDAIELTGPIGDGFGVNLDTPLFSIPEDTVGLTLASGSIISPKVPDPTAPQFTRTLIVPSTFPFGALASQTTTGGLSYDMGIAISDSGFNQILAGLVSSGLLKGEILELDLFGSGTPAPLTAGLLALLIPEFGQLPPATTLFLRFAPTLAPVLTGNTGPGGEIAEMILSHLLIEIYSGSPGPGEELQGRLAIDAVAAFDLTIDPVSGGLLPAIPAPDPNDVVVTLLDNPLGMSEATLQLLLPGLVAPLVPQLGGAFGAFPLPAFLGIEPDPIEISRAGDFLSIWLQVVASP